jgi:hypothetical protein
VRGAGAGNSLHFNLAGLFFGLRQIVGRMQPKPSAPPPKAISGEIRLAVNEIIQSLPLPET